MSAVSTLAARVTALERQVAALRGRAGGGEQLSPNYLTVNAQGQVGASFTGLINAQGMVVPEAATIPPPIAGANAVTWQDAGGTTRQFIEGYFSAPDYGLAVGTTPDGSDHAVIYLVSDAAGAAGSSQIVAQVQDSTIAPSAYGPLIIGSDGKSSFLQLLSAQKLQIALGTGTFTGNGTASVNPTNAINTQLAAIVAVAACPKPIPTWGGYLSCVNTAPTSLQFAANTNGTFANGTTYSFYYIAIG